MPVSLPIAPDTFLQLSNRDTGWTYRVATDGRYFVTPQGAPERQEPPISKLERGTQVVTASGLQRLGAALELAGFFALSDELVTPRPPPTLVLPDGEAPKLVTWVFSAAGPSGMKTVSVVGDVRMSPTLGALSLVYAALDREALGGWQDE